MNREKILLVEDQDVGSIYKKSIEKSLDVDVIWVKNKSHAIENVENNNIKVAILDQRLEAGELGTDILESIKRINPFITVIMLSGQAIADDVNDAYKLGLFKYLNKKNVKQLAPLILEALHHYEVQSLNEEIDSQRKLLLKFSDGFNFWKKYKVYLVSQSCVEESYLFEESWKERLEIVAGQQQEYSEEIEISSEIVFENKVVTEIGTKYALKISELKNSLSVESNNKISNSLLYKQREGNKVVKKHTIKTELPPIPENVREDYLASKSYQINQVYKKYVNIISVECPCCSSSDFYSVITYIPTNKIARREVSIYRKGNKEVLDCGVITLTD